jgi:hypothetical protein
MFWRWELRMNSVASKNGWRKVAFSEVVKLSGERSANPELAGIEHYVGLDHMDPGDLKIRRWGDIVDGTTFTTVFRPGQVLFGKGPRQIRTRVVFWPCGGHQGRTRAILRGSSSALQ